MGHLALDDVDNAFKFIEAGIEEQNLLLWVLRDICG